jgi:hypothetical protein
MSQAIEDWKLRELLSDAFQRVYDEQKVIDVGHSAIGFVTLNVPVADDWFSIGGRVYCYNPTGGVPYDVAIAGLDAAATVTAINDDPERTVDAFSVGGNDLVALVAVEGGVEGNSLSLAESTGGARLVLRSGSMEEGKDEYQRRICTVAFDFKATDITALAAGERIPVMGIPSEATPEVGSANALRGNSFLPLTANVDFFVQQVNSHYWTVQIEDGGPVFQAGDVLLLLVWV